MGERMTSDRVVPPDAPLMLGGTRRVPVTAAIGRRPPTGRPLSPEVAPWVELALTIGEGPARQRYYALHPRMEGRYRWWERHVGRALARRQKTHK